MTAPTVSVVMAAYNGAALIGETLDSLWTQTFDDFEVVVVDDRSTDDTLAVLARCRDPRLRVIALDRNGGPVRARNCAYRESRGRYIAGLDQDDLCLPARFERQVAYLDANPRIALAGTAAAVLEDGTIASGIRSPVTTPRLVEWLLQIENPLVWSTVMVRRAAVPPGDFTRPELLYAEDFDLYHRLARDGGIAQIDEPLLLYRSHGAGASQRFVDMMQASAARVLAETYAADGDAEAVEDASIVARCIMRRQPVADRIELARLGGVLGRLQARFLATRAVDPDSRRMIKWETALRWGRVVRHGLKAGTITLIDAVAVRPDHLGLGYAGIDTLLLSRLIGGARSVVRRRRAA
ncbi:glycosyltransferase family 2 protein [uncultured Sphingomonas sp.]|uniref:glycosyltransferase family 2 protein n=1 Tax=uncultured Sphingomonas sp. TaxID=158754 RepID=UPI0035CAE87A